MMGDICGSNNLLYLALDGPILVSILLFIIYYFWYIIFGNLIEVQLFCMEKLEKI